MLSDTSCIRKLLNSENEAQEDQESFSGQDESMKLVGGFSFEAPTHACEMIPQSATMALKKMGISEASTLGGITFLPERSVINLHDAKNRRCNRYAWVAPIDEKGSTSLVIKKLLFNLHNVRKFYDSIDKPGAKNAPFEPVQAVPNDANVNYRGGMAYHYVTTQDEVITIPAFTISMFVDVAHTGGKSAMTQAYQFIVLETPLTFDLVQCITLSCKKTHDPDGAQICETMKAFWCDIASMMYRMGGETDDINACSMARIRYEDLFDFFSPFCIWKLFRVSRCIYSARRHMHLMATQVRHENTRESWKEASSKIEVRFENIDRLCAGRYDPYAYDSFFVNISDRSSSAWYSSFESYKALVENFKKKRKSQSRNANEGTQGEAPEPEAEEFCEPFDPPVLYDCPLTQADYNDTETTDFLRDAMFNHCIDMNVVDDFFKGSGQYTTSLKGFPDSLMCASVELNLFRPDTNRYLKFDDWLSLNSCDLPREMTLPLLLLNDSKNKDGNNDISARAAIYASLESNLPKSCLHVENFRQFLRAGGNSNNVRRPLKGRCDHIYLMQHNAVRNISDPRRRVQHMYGSYITGTVIPLVEANVKSDNGEMGGSEPRLTILSEIAGSPAPDPKSRYSCYITSKFQEGLENLLCNFPASAEMINRYRGNMHSAENAIFLIHQTMNINGNLKPDNQRMKLLLSVSDTGFYLNGLGGQFQMAKNFIGLSLWCQNFNGNADTREKTRGVGVDEAINQFNYEQTPTQTEPPPKIDISGYPDCTESKSASSTAFFNKYSTTINKNGERIDSITINQPNLHLTEMKQNEDGKNPMWSIVNDNMLRNYLVSTLGKRDISVQDANGKWSCHEQILTMQPRFLIFATNSNSREHYAHTVETICHIVSAAGVDEDDHNSRKRRRHMGAREDMGKQERYYGRRQIPWVSKTSHMWGRDITSLSCFVAFIHSCSFFGHQGLIKINAGIEVCWQDIVISLVHQHKSWMNTRANCPQNWNRVTDMARTRAVPYGLQLHATNTLLHPDSKKKTWHDLIHETLVNFIADPVPAQSLPVFTASLMCTAFDWLFFVCIGMFCNLFEVPAIDPETMEHLFSDPNAKIAGSQTIALRRWLQASGVSTTSSMPQKFSAITAPRDNTNMQRSVVYITTLYEEGGDFTETSLTCNVEPPRPNNYGDDSRSVSTTERVCTVIAKVLVKLFSSRLRSACNIADHDQGNYKAYRPIAACLLRYCTERLPYHKFGPVPSGDGWKSVDGICRSLGLNNGFLGEGFVNAGQNNMMDGGSYETSPFIVRQAAGNIYQFGVDFRWLIFVKAIFGRRPCISQSSIQAIFHHLTEQFIIHRVPRSIFPASHIFTTMTASENGGFSYTKLNSSSRPWTMTRPAPDSIVLDSKCKSSSGLIENLIMPEDCALSRPAFRLADSLSDEACQVTVNDVVLPELHPPQLPIEQHVYVDIRVFKRASGNVTETVHPGVVFTHDSVKGVLYCETGEHSRPPGITRMDRDGTLHHKRFRHSDFDHVQCCLSVMSEGNLYRVLAPSSDRYLHFGNYYCRRGILLELEIENGCTVYAVVKQWTQDDLECPVRWFNPNTMGYLAVCNEVKHATPVWPEDAPQFMSDSPSLFQKNEFSFNIPAPLFAKQMVPIGRELYLDCNSCEINAIKGDDSWFLGFSDSPYVQLSGAQRCMNLEEFHKKVVPTPGDGSKVQLLSVVAVTLCYEMPKSVFCHDIGGEDELDSCVFVGFRVLQKSCNRRVSENIQYAAVSARSLVTQSRLDAMNLRPVLFSFYE